MNTRIRRRAKLAAAATLTSVLLAGCGVLSDPAATPTGTGDPTEQGNQGSPVTGPAIPTGPIDMSPTPPPTRPGPTGGMDPVAANTDVPVGLSFGVWAYQAGPGGMWRLSKDLLYTASADPRGWFVAAWDKTGKQVWTQPVPTYRNAAEGGLEVDTGMAIQNTHLLYDNGRIMLVQRGDMPVKGLDKPVQGWYVHTFDGQTGETNNRPAMLPDPNPTTMWETSLGTGGFAAKSTASYYDPTVTSLPVYVIDAEAGFKQVDVPKSSVEQVEIVGAWGGNVISQSPTTYGSEGGVTSTAGWKFPAATVIGGGGGYLVVEVARVPQGDEPDPQMSDVYLLDVNDGKKLATAVCKGRATGLGGQRDRVTWSAESTWVAAGYTVFNTTTGGGFCINETPERRSARMFAVREDGVAWADTDSGFVIDEQGTKRTYAVIDLTKQRDDNADPEAVVMEEAAVYMPVGFLGNVAVVASDQEGLTLTFHPRADMDTGR